MEEIAFQAVISASGDQIVLSPTLQLKHFTLEILTKELAYPFYIENDGTSGSYTEWLMQASKRNMAYLSLENGVGGSVLVNGNIYRRQPPRWRVQPHVYRAARSFL